MVLFLLLLFTVELLKFIAAIKIHQESSEVWWEKSIGIKHWFEEFFLVSSQPSQGLGVLTVIQNVFSSALQF